MTCTADLILPPSGDYAATTVLRNEDGSPVDLTGFTASIVDVTGVLASAVTASIVTPAAGTVRIAVAWQGAWPITPQLLGTFRLLLVSGTTEIPTVPNSVWVQGVATTLDIPRGADFPLPFTWPDSRDGADLTGETVDVINASATLAPLVTVAVIDAATRACRIDIEGDLAVPLGSAGTFQLRRRTGSTNPRTLPPIAVTFQ
jgi:hypothetical protein